MTQDTTITDELAAVEQCDRDAFAALARTQGMRSAAIEAERGDWDRSPQVQAFARHRLSTRPKDSPTEQGEVAREFEARVVVGGMPTDCCDYGVISHMTGKEVCRVWLEDDVRRIADLLNASLSHPVSTNMPVAEAVREAAAKALNRQANINIDADPDDHPWEKQTEQTKDWCRAMVDAVLSTITASTTEGGGE